MKYLVKNWIFSPASPDLWAPLHEFSAYDSSPCRRTISSCSPECALACVPSPHAPYFSGSLKSWHQCLTPQRGCRRLAAESHIVIEVAFQVSCFSPLHADSFTDLTSKAALLSLKRCWVGIYTFSADKESPQILHFLCSILFSPVCLRVSRSLLQGSRLLLSSSLLQLLQENLEVFQCSSFSITWVCLRANNQEFTPTHAGVMKAPYSAHSSWSLCFYDYELLLMWIHRSSRLYGAVLVLFLFKWVQNCSYRCSSPPPVFFKKWTIIFVLC